MLSGTGETDTVTDSVCEAEEVAEFEVEADTTLTSEVDEDVDDVELVKETEPDELTSELELTVADTGETTLDDGVEKTDVLLVTSRIVEFALTLGKTPEAVREAVVE